MDESAESGWYDVELPLVSELIDAFVGNIEDDHSELILESMQLSFACEMDVVTESDTVIAVSASPPVYHVDTSVEPVFHRLSLTIARETSG
jgi:hypothetical protein